jgi:hypothetical protein
MSLVFREPISRFAAIRACLPDYALDARAAAYRARALLLRRTCPRTRIVFETIMRVPSGRRPTIDGRTVGDRKRMTMAIRKPRTNHDRRATSASVPARDDVARRAYERFLARGATHGRDCEDWFEAERELHGAPVRAPRRVGRSIAAPGSDRS